MRLLLIERDVCDGALLELRMRRTTLPITCIERHPSLEAALEALAAVRFDLAVFAGGYETRSLAERIWELSLSAPDVPILALLSDAGTDDETSCLAAGAFACVRKEGLSPTVLQRTIEDALALPRSAPAGVSPSGGADAPGAAFERPREAGDRLATNIAHEINNPASFVLANLSHLSARFDQLTAPLQADPKRAREVAEARTMLEESLAGIRRIRAVVSRRARAGGHDPSGALAEGGDATRAGLPSLAERGPEPPTRGRSPRVLLLDDEAMIRSCYQRILQPEYECTAVGSAESALELLAEDCTFDAILCDIDMPDMDGVAFFEILAEKYPALGRRVAFVTGGVFSARAASFLARTQMPVFHKPLTRMELVEGVGSLVLARH